MAHHPNTRAALAAGSLAAVAAGVLAVADPAWLDGWTWAAWTVFGLLALVVAGLVVIDRLPAKVEEVTPAARAEEMMASFRLSLLTRRMAELQASHDALESEVEGFRRKDGTTSADEPSAAVPASAAADVERLHAELAQLRERIAEHEAVVAAREAAERRAQTLEAAQRDAAAEVERLRAHCDEVKSAELAVRDEARAAEVAARDRIDAAESEATALRERVAAAETRARARDEGAAGADAERAALAAEFESLRDAERTAREHVARLEKDVAALRGGIAGLPALREEAARAARLRQDNDQLQKRAAAADAEFAAASAKAETLAREVAASTSKAAALETQLAAARATAEELEGALSAMSSRAQSAEQALRDQAESFREERRVHEAAQAEFRARQDAPDAAAAEVRRLGAEVADARAALAAAQESERAARSELAALEREVVALRSEVTVIPILREEVARLEPLETEIEGLQARIAEIDEMATAEARRAESAEDALEHRIQELREARNLHAAELAALRTRCAEAESAVAAGKGLAAEVESLRERAAEVDALRERADAAEEAVRAALRELGVDPAAWPLTAAGVVRAVGPITLYALGESAPDWQPDAQDDTLAAAVLRLAHEVQERQRQVERLGAALTRNGAHK